MIMIGILSLLAIAAFYITACRSSKEVEEGKVATPRRAKRAPQVGEAAPDFTLPNLDRNDVRLSDFRGKVIFLSFWSIRCDPCKDGMPLMEVLYQRLKGEDFELLAVSLDRQWWASRVGPFARDYGLSFPILLDLTGEIGSIYGVRRTPTTFILDKDVVIIEKVIGSKDWASQDSIEKFQRLISQD